MALSTLFLFVCFSLALVPETGRNIRHDKPNVNGIHTWLVDSKKIVKG